MKQISKKTDFRLIDKISIAYLLLNILYIVFGWQHVDKPFFNLVTFIALAALIPVIIKIQKSFDTKLTRFLKNFYPIIYFTYLFEATSAVNNVIFKNDLDFFFQKIDFLIFGYQPAIVWGKVLDSWFFQEFFHFAYFSYYLMIIFIPIYFYLKKSKRNFNELVFSLSLLFYFCYLLYMVLPVVGGRTFSGIDQIVTTYEHGPFSRIMAFIYRNTAHRGGAFPSSHVAVAVLLALFSFNINRFWGWLLFFTSVMLSFSTVICHYHYFIDVIFGFPLGILFYFIGKDIFKRFNRQVYE